MLSAQSEVDTPEIRVAEWRSAPGSVTNHHIHEMGAIIVPVITREKTIMSAGGAPAKARLGLGKSCFRKAGAEHDVLNATATDLVFPEIELK